MVLWLAGLNEDPANHKDQCRLHGRVDREAIKPVRRR